MNQEERVLRISEIEACMYNNVRNPSQEVSRVQGKERDWLTDIGCTVRMYYISWRRRMKERHAHVVA